MNNQEKLISVFEHTLLNNGEDTVFYSPTSVAKYRTTLNIKNASIMREVSYTLQHLEYMCFEFECVNHHIIVNQMQIKNFIISAASIIEGMLTDYVYRNGFTKKGSPWKILGKEFHSQKNNILNFVNEFNDKETRITSTLEIKVDENERENLDVSLQELIELITNSSKKNYYIHGLGIPTEDLQFLRNLRNMVHLTMEESSYKEMTFPNLKKVRNILYNFLKNKNFMTENSENSNIYEYLIDSSQINIPNSYE
ncbi:hypothetical protein [Convivina intestini]|uniref:Uncharacterized protein n=1 Tax=Convivina intestini TaxID=1505726 RepID=A0A2U1D5A3_9LACO|nr:hypothetical protein [Convivina intestini]PVY82830.1 hypothetical protein C7384_11024 [Convivina intestini]CAH1856825.1 hypothetical protein R077811_01346 [Convivina intestini]SDC19690.1 hypothetical protein SAMN05216341_11912 [Leuconostocaceae bacterium R-53105]